MSRLVTSDNALRALLLLSQGGEGLRTSDVAEDLGISYTGAEKSLAILVADGLAVASNRRYAIADSARAREAVRFALVSLSADVVLAALARGNDAVEFAGMDDLGAIVVFRRFADPAAEARMRKAVTDLGEFAPEVQVKFADKADLREQLLSDLTSRRRAEGMRVLAGTVDVTFPDRTRHGDFEAPSLGRLNAAIATPSARRLEAIARRYGLRRILAFGSVTRADFRPDSDIDLFVEPISGRHLGLHERVGLITEAERLFGRDVDLRIAPTRPSSLAQQVSRDGVVLYDAAR